MKRKPIILFAVLVLMLALTACSAGNKSSQAPVAPQSSATSLPQQEGVALAQAPSIEEQVQAALALTQVAQVNRPLSDQEIQTAIALTQAVVTPMPIVNPQVVAAVVGTQEAQTAEQFSEQEIQTAIAQVQLEAPAAENVQQQPDAAATSTPTPPISIADIETAFSGASIYRWGMYQHKVYAFTIQLSSGTAGNFYAMLRKEKYKCALVPDRPDRLFCYGRHVNGGNLDFSVYEEGSDRLLFTQEIALPTWVPTKTPSPTPRRARVWPTKDDVADMKIITPVP